MKKAEIIKNGNVNINNINNNLDPIKRLIELIENDYLDNEEVSNLIKTIKNNELINKNKIQDGFRMPK